MTDQLVMNAHPLQNVINGESLILRFKILHNIYDAISVSLHWIKTYNVPEYCLNILISETMVT